MPIELTGVHTTARIMVDDESLVEAECLAQIQALIDHPAFTEPVRIMPDTHWGAGAPIGFTMPLPDQVVPNVVGVDVGCFTGDTMVPLVDGDDHRLDELAQREDSFVVFSCKPDGEVVCAEATAHQTRTNADLVEVEIDNGETIQCTPDHEFMLRDGSYRHARNLERGDSLMPLYRYETDEGYVTVDQNVSGQTFQRVHWMVARAGLMGEIPSFDDQRTVIHHENFEPSDNRPSNLRFMSASEHSRLHRELSDGDHWQSEAFKEKRIEGIRQRAQTEERHRQMAKVSTENICRYMEENPEEWYEKVSDNGQHGKQYLAEWNRSQEARRKASDRANSKYECEFCGDEVKSYIGLHNHKNANHPEEYDAHRETPEYECEVCDRVIKSRAGMIQHQRHTHDIEYDATGGNFVQLSGNNHEVSNVTRLSETADVYCLNVPDHHNFALSAGVFVHNCGMAAANLGDELPLADAERERRVRDAVPMGRDVHDDGDAVNLVEAFPFARANDRFERFDDAFAAKHGRRVDPPTFEFDGYDADYFHALCDRVLADQRLGTDHVINSAGTLGGGNHFVEFNRAQTSHDYWLVVHSGSRYLGKAVAEYWQGRATSYRNADGIRAAVPDDLARFLKFDLETVSDADLYAWVTGGKGESHIDRERVRRELDGKEIERAFDALGDLRPESDARNTDLDPLEGREAHGYYVDMLFAQQYARWNRELMVEAICEALGVEPVDRFQSPHNMIDFDDLVIRKGATPARKGQRLVIPFNMGDGSIIARGKGNPEWFDTAPHGAGRVMGRRDAHERLDPDEVEQSMSHVYTTHIPTDEAPAAYKSSASIMQNIVETVEIIERLDPVHNLKSR